MQGLLVPALLVAVITQDVVQGVHHGARCDEADRVSQSELAFVLFESPLGVQRCCMGKVSGVSNALNEFFDGRGISHNSRRYARALRLHGGVADGLVYGRS